MCTLILLVVAFWGRAGGISLCQNGAVLVWHCTFERVCTRSASTRQYSLKTRICYDAMSYGLENVNICEK